MLRLENCTIANGSYCVTADFTIPPHSRVAVIGPSGAGKTTLLEAIAGFLPLHRGRILWQGQDMTDTPPGQRPVAMLFQDDNLFPHLSIARNVGLGIRPDLRLSPSQTQQVTRALARVGLSGLENRRPAELSGGQRSRAALARVLVQGRDLLLLDEPFAALGPRQRTDMLDLVADLCAETGATLLMISHAPQDARQIAPQSIIVAQGHAAAPADTVPLLDNPPEALRDYL